MKNSYITRALTTDGSARIIFIDSTGIVEAARLIHGTSKTMTAVLGRCLTAASLMGSFLKDKDNSLTFQVRGDGPAGTIVCVSDYSGNVRGYADCPTVELPPNEKGKLDVGGAVGEGSLYIIKDMGMNEPYVGICPLVSGEIGEDLTEYFAVSEQTPSVCAFGVRVNNNECYAAGGFIVQLLPGADEAVIEIIESNMASFGSVSEMIASGSGAPEVISAVFHGIEYDMFDEIDTEYKCTCNREKYKMALVGLVDEDMDEMRCSGEPIEASCRFCGTKYVFDIDEIDDARETSRGE